MAKKQYLTISPYTKRNLPDGYTQALYIQSHGNEYINTEILPSSKTKMVLDCDITYGSGWVMIAGAYETGARFSWWSTGSTLEVNYVSYTKQTTGIQGRGTLVANNNEWTVGETKMTLTNTSFAATTLPLYLFSVNGGSGVPLATMKVYASLLYDGDTLVRDYVPCYVDATGEYGLFDMVTQSFYGNKGTGAFGGLRIANLPDGYTQVEHIESNGTQWLDTGVTVKSNLVSQLKFNMTAATGDVIYGSYPNSDVNDYRLFNFSNGCYLDFPNEQRINGGTMAAGVDYEIEIGNFYVKDLTTRNNIISGSAFSFAAQSNTLKMWIYEGATTKYSSGKLYYLKIYEGSTLVRDFVPCVSSAGVAGLFDLVTSTFYGNKGSGVFATGQAIGNAWREVKKRYLSIGGTHHKVKKGYMTIGGVFRPFISGGVPTYYGTITGLSNARTASAGGNAGEYAVFGGGRNSSTIFGTVDAYTKTFTRQTATALSTGRWGLSACKAGSYLLFAGGLTGKPSDSGYSAEVNAYDSSLTRTTPTALSKSRVDMGATSVGGYAIFAGGRSSSTSGTNTVDIYSSSLTRTTGTLNQSRYYLGAASTDTHAIFASGRYDGNNNYARKTVEAFDASLTRSSLADLATGKAYLRGARAGEYALFAGGEGSNTVEGYGTSLTKTTATNLTVARGRMASGSLGEYAVFAGGLGVTNVVEMYDASLTQTTPAVLSAASVDPAAANVGEALLISGGATNAVQMNPVGTMDAFVLD